MGLAGPGNSSDLGVSLAAALAAAGPGIAAALARGDVMAAATAAEVRLAAGDRDPLLAGIVAWRHELDEDLGSAEAAWRAALALAPDSAMLRTALAAVVRRRGRLSESLPMLDAVVAREPAYAAGWLERGYTAHAGGALEIAAESYHTAARLDPASAAAPAGFAAVAVLLGYPVAARNFAARALAIDPAEPVATCALAAVEIEDKEFRAAAERIAALLDSPSLGTSNRAAALVLLGQARDRLGDHPAAFAAFAAANRVTAEQHAAHFGPDSAEPSHRATVERLHAAVARVPAAGWVSPVTDGGGCGGVHAFLVGYPRSGTTMVENVLATAPGTVALEERPTLDDAVVEFMSDGAGIARLAALDSATARRFQSLYWARVAAMDADVPGKTFVDMDPLGSLRLPLVAKLFPDARVVVMRRDPRDVVWSCFRTAFAPSAAFYEFTDLERAARHYDATMRLLDLYLERLPIRVHTVRYPDLVDDFDRVTRRLCDFLDLPWTPALRDFGATARARGVSTASVTQVRRGLYSGDGQWRPYAAQLAPVRAILDPWATKFGFPL